MVVSSRSTRGRSSVRNEPDSSPSSNTSRPVNTINDIHDHDASIVQQQPQHEDAGSSRAKRSRLTSISDRESLQKRRRLSKGDEAGPPQVHIPLRGRTAQDQKHIASRIPAVPPPLVTRDSDISNNSPLDSPNPRPTYDQFKRIEEKAQKVVKKHSAKDEKRKLRSEHGSTRSKTELAQYFPNFDDLLSLEPEDPEILTAKTQVELVNDTPSFRPPPSQPDFFRSQQIPHKSEVLDLEKYIEPNHAVGSDPLSESVYLKAHQKAERHEKQIKNGDKERAQHEKYQLERLLEELRGPDWLKTLGISGITDTEKKRYEIKRNLFIRETKILINKFKRWKEEEKRRKLEKQQQLLEEAGAEQDDKASSSTIPKVKAKPRVRHGPNSRNQSQANSRAASVAANHALDSNELDALASQQLLEEAKKATSRPKAGSISLPLLPEIPTRPFVSFFAKRHIRDAAVLGRNRGRKIYVKTPLRLVREAGGGRCAVLMIELARYLSGMNTSWLLYTSLLESIRTQYRSACLKLILLLHTSNCQK